MSQVDTPSSSALLELLDPETRRLLRLERQLRASEPKPNASQAHIQTYEALKLLQFVRHFWPVLEPTTQFIYGWSIGAICEHLEALTAGQIEKLLINVPPGFSKSLLCNVFWPSWEWATDPSLRWLHTSNNIALSTRDSVKMRRLITSAEYQERYQNAYQLEADQNAKQRYDTTKGGYRIVVPLTSAIGERADRLVIDDPNNPLEVYSDAHLEEVTNAYDQVFSQRAGNHSTFRQVVVMQRLAERDLSGHLLERGGWEHLRLPMEFEDERRCMTSIGFTDPRNHHGELLFPERFPQHVVDQQKKDLGPSAAGQLQQNPAPSTGGIIKNWYLAFWYPQGTAAPQPYRVRLESGEWHECPQRERPAWFDLEAQSWDMAFKDTRSSAFVAGQVWGKLQTDAFLLDQVRERMDIVATMEAVLTLTASWPQAGAKYVEDRANGPAVMQLLRSRVPGLIAVQPEGSKEARLHAVAPFFQSLNVWLPHPTLFPWVHELIKELLQFPNGVYKDQVDTLSQMLKKFFLDTPRQGRANTPATTAVRAQTIPIGSFRR